MVEEQLREDQRAARLALDQPQDDVAVALAVPAHGRETVGRRLLLARLAARRAQWESRSKATEPSGSVAASASKAAGVMAMRFIRCGHR